MDALTKQLADALRYQLRYHPEHTVGMCRDALEAFDSAKNAPEAVPLDLQPLHDLAAKWETKTKYHSTYDDFAKELKEVIAKLQEVGEVGSTKMKCDGCGSRPVVAAIAIAQGKIACCPDCATFTGVEINQLSAALKATQSDLQPLHDLVAKWAVAANYEQRAVSFSLSVCAREVEKALAKIQSAGGAP